MKTLITCAAALAASMALAGTALAQSCITDLVAGQFTNVGTVEISEDGGNLVVQYMITEPDWCITETHLQIATSDPGLNPNSVIQKNGNPRPGKFDYKESHECVTEYTYVIPIDDVDPNWDCDTLYVAAHAVVQVLVGYQDPNLYELEAGLPEQVTMSVSYPYAGAPSYFGTTVSGGTLLDGTYLGYCIDTDQTIGNNTAYTANVYSSYELAAQVPGFLVEHPENLDLVNWIINQDYVGQDAATVFGANPDSPACGGTISGVITYGDVQRAIWSLIDDNNSTSGLGSWSECHVEEILAAAYTNGEGFTPGCDDVVAVILEPVNGQQITIAQVTFIEAGVPCDPVFDTETAWGDGYDFPGKNWATYFSCDLCFDQNVEWPEGGTMSIAFEDLPLGGNNDWDYNDLVVDIETNAVFYGTVTNRVLTEITFNFYEEAKIAGFTHKLNFTDGIFGGCVGTYELYRNGGFIESGIYDDNAPPDLLLIQNSANVGSTATVKIFFPTGCAFEFPAWDGSLYHGENLFFDPYAYVNNTGQEIHTGDPRMLTVPIDWQWPSPDGTKIWWVYPDVGAVPNTSLVGPTFVPFWYNNYVGP